MRNPHAGFSLLLPPAVGMPEGLGGFLAAVAAHGI